MNENCIISLITINGYFIKFVKIDKLFNVNFKSSIENLQFLNSYYENLQSKNNSLIKIK